MTTPNELKPDLRARYAKRPGGPTKHDVRLNAEALAINAKRRKESALEKAWPSSRSRNADGKGLAKRAPIYRTDARWMTREGRSVSDIIKALCSPWSSEALLERRRHDGHRAMIRLIAAAPDGLLGIVHYISELFMAIEAFDETCNAENTSLYRSEMLHMVADIVLKADRIWVSTRDAAVADGVVTEEQRARRDERLSPLVETEAHLGEVANPLKRFRYARPHDQVLAKRREHDRVRREKQRAKKAQAQMHAP